MFWLLDSVSEMFSFLKSVLGWVVGGIIAVFVWLKKGHGELFLENKRLHKEIKDLNQEIKDLNKEIKDLNYESLKREDSYKKFDDQMKGMEIFLASNPIQEVIHSMRTEVDIDKKTTEKLSEELSRRLKKHLEGEKID